MTTSPKDSTVRVVLDEEFRIDLERASEATGIRNRSDLVRYCVRQVARQPSAGAS